MKHKLAICAAFALGAALGLFIAKPPIAHAQPAQILVRVSKVVGMSADDPSRQGSAFVSGPIVGFSCVHGPIPECYVAYSLGGSPRR